MHRKFDSLFLGFPENGIGIAPFAADHIRHTCTYCCRFQCLMESRLNKIALGTNVGLEELPRLAVQQREQFLLCLGHGARIGYL